jgi:hypothetical protein
VAEAQQMVKQLEASVDVAVADAHLRAKISEILRGIDEGQFASSGSLARGSSVGPSTEYSPRITTPKDIDPATLRLGMAVQATVFSDYASPIGLIAPILLFVKAYASTYDLALSTIT